MKEIEVGRFYRLLYPTVPAVLASSFGSTVSGMPVVSVTMLSESPPIVGVSSAPTHHTFRTIARSKTFSLSWLDRKHKGSVEKLASSAGRPEFDKLSSAGLSHHKGKRLRVPVPDVASAVLECKLLGTRRIGDHVLLLGQVVVAYASEDFKDYWLFKEYRPILYTGWRRGLGIYD